MFHQAQTLLVKHCFFTTGTVECWMPSWSCDRQGWFTLSTDRFDPTVWPNSRDNLTVAIENYLWSSDQRLTCQTTAVNLRLLFYSDASSPTDRFFIRFSIQPYNQSGNGTPALISHTQWVTGTSDHHVSVVVSFFFTSLKPLHRFASNFACMFLGLNHGATHIFSWNCW